MRRELVKEITTKAGSEEDLWNSRSKKLSSTTAHKTFEALTGEEKQAAKGRSWHLRKIVETLDTEVRKGMQHNGVQLPVDALKEINQKLDQTI